jgi:hypothetical protein
MPTVFREIASQVTESEAAGRPAASFSKVEIE